MSKRHKKRIIYIGGEGAFGEQFYGNPHVDALVGANNQNLIEFRQQMTDYVGGLITGVPAVLQLLNIWVADSSPFNGFNYPQNDSLAAKYRLITGSHQYASIAALFQLIGNAFQTEPAWRYQEFKDALMARYPPPPYGVAENTEDKYQVVIAFACIRSWLNNIIWGAPRFGFPLYLFRLTKSGGQEYEFVQDQPEDKFTSYTMFPFGSTMHQDVVSVTHFSDADCCFSIAALPPGAPCLYIPNEFTAVTVDEIVTPLRTQKTELQDLGMQTYTYTPVATRLEAEPGVNLIPAIRQQEMISFPADRSTQWSQLQSQQDLPPIKTLFRFNSPVTLNLQTFQYTLIPPPTRGGGAANKKKRKKNTKKRKAISKTRKRKTKSKTRRYR